MAAKKYYAVKKGKVTGIFQSWEECRNAVEGYSGAQYKGFSTFEEAGGYMGNISAGHPAREGEEASAGHPVRENEEASAGHPVRENEEASAGHPARESEEASAGHSAHGAGRHSGDLTASREDELLAYVDGSYDDRIKKYAFGCVFLLPDGRIYTEYGNGNNAQSLQHRNVTGEMLGAMYAVKFAMLNGFRSVELRYDYQGIEKWVTGEWRSKTELTRKYAQSMREWGKSISIRFTKVAAHTNVTYNELADKMAKTGLTLGDGVPKIRRLEDMEEYHGADETE
ncbi:MAG: reverse transcriptase-like protein [Lachnospiraceae bacterium]|nr:reverse transcriptase-like protein [Lachnospiraceae bacterium]